MLLGLTFNSEGNSDDFLVFFLCFVLLMIASFSGFCAWVEARNEARVDHTMPNSFATKCAICVS